MSRSVRDERFHSAVRSERFADALRFAWRTLRRDWASGELRVLAFSLLIAVTALSAVAFFTNRVGNAVKQQSGEVLAADLRLESGVPTPQAYIAAARARGLQTTEVLGFPSVAFHGDSNALTALHAVSAGYPLRGHLKIADRMFAPAYETDSLPARGEAWADERLLALLGIDVGSQLKIGSLELRVARVLEYRPDQSMQFSAFAPSLLIDSGDIPASQLVQPGSRVSYAALFAGSPSQIAAFKAWLEPQKKSGERLVDITEASPQISSSSDRAGRFLNLSAMVSVLLAAIAVAMAARRYAARQLDTVALLKTLGASQGFISRVYLSELFLLGVVAGIVGTAAGYAAQGGLALLLKDLARGDLPPPGLGPVVLGLTTALFILIGFALPQILQLRHVPPARVFRRALEPPQVRFILLYGLSVAATLATLFLISRDWKLVVYTGAGAAATFIALGLAGFALVNVLQRVRGGVGVAWRYGLANIARRGAGSVIQIVAFGLGLMVLLLLAIVRQDLLNSWQAGLPKTVPNHFLINIRPDETDAVQRFLQQRGVEAPEMVPMVRARLTAINGVAIDTGRFKSDRAKNFLEREANLTWSKTLNPDNKLVAGQWWEDGDGGGARVSIDKPLADDLELKLGDRLSYDVAGEPVEARVASFREVQWDSFKPNFFMVFSPGVLDAGSGTFVTSVRLTPEQRPLVAQLVRQFPEITVIDFEAILTQVRSVMDKATSAVEYVFVFTLGAGVMVLLAAVQASRDERRYESAILRALGASRSVVLKGIAAEFAALGLLAGILAAAGATVAGYFLATRLFNLKYSFDPTLWLVGMTAGVAIVALSGILATRSVLNQPPMAALSGIPQ